MKNLFYLLLALPMLWIGCSDDDDDRYVSLVTVTESNGELLFMRSDSALMNPTNFTIISNPGQRMLIEYGIHRSYPAGSAYSYDIRLSDYDIVLTKNVVDMTSENEGIIGNDAFWNVYYMNSGGNFLNVYLSFLYNYNPHTVNLINNTVTPPVNTQDTIYLELRQNANGQNIGFPVNELVSFNVDSYLTTAKENGVEELVLVVDATLPNSVTSRFNVKFNIDAPNSTEPTYNSLSVYNPEENAVN